MQYTQPLGIECEHAECVAPATETIETEERGAMHFCALHAAERLVSPVGARPQARTE